MISNPHYLSDITGRPDLVRLVDCFYAKVRADEGLGNVFDHVAKVNWESHLPKLYDFWDSVIFRAGTFRGNLIAAHANLLPLTDLDWPMFERWLELFRAAVTELFFRRESQSHCPLRRGYGKRDLQQDSQSAGSAIRSSTTHA